MPSSKPQSKVYLTVDQYQAESDAIEKSGLSASEFRRQALKQMIESYGINFPEDMPQHGGTREGSGRPLSWTGFRHLRLMLQQELQNIEAASYYDDYEYVRVSKEIDELEKRHPDFSKRWNNTFDLECRECGHEWRETLPSLGCPECGSGEFSTV